MGEGGVGVAVEQCFDNGMHAIRIANHVVIPESRKLVALALD
jgi:hypothetical protein